MRLASEVLSLDLTGHSSPIAPYKENTLEYSADMTDTNIR